jgi:hypothetical protein
VGLTRLRTLEFSIDLMPPDGLEAWELTQPLTEMSTSNLPWVEGGRVRPAPEADLTAICEPIV